MNMFC